jgi:hypothetical protein
MSPRQVLWKAIPFTYLLKITHNPFSDKRADSKKFAKDDSERKQGSSHGRRNEKSREYKEKRQSEEKEKSATKVT